MSAPYSLGALRGLGRLYADGLALPKLANAIAAAMGYASPDALRAAAIVQESPSSTRDRDKVHGAARYALEVIAAAHGKRGIARRRELAPLSLALDSIIAAAVYEAAP